MVGVSMRSTMDRYIISPMEGFKTGYSWAKTGYLRCKTGHSRNKTGHSRNKTGHWNTRWA